MGTIIAQAIIDDVEETLFDPGNVRWLEEDLLKYLNSGQRYIVLLKPDANVITESVQLVTGTKQSIPAAGSILIDNIRNMGTDGATPGSIIRRVEKEVIDSFDYQWHEDTVSDSVEHYHHNENNPKIFYVIPPQPSSSQGYIETSYSAIPSDITADAVITLDDIYEDPLKHYIMYRAYQKSTQMQDIGKSKQYYQLLSQELGFKEQVEAGVEEKHGDKTTI